MTQPEKSEAKVPTQRQPIGAVKLGQILREGKPQVLLNEEESFVHEKILGYEETLQKLRHLEKTFKDDIEDLEEKLTPIYKQIENIQKQPISLLERVKRLFITTRLQKNNQNLILNLQKKMIKGPKELSRKKEELVLLQKKIIETTEVIQNLTKKINVNQSKESDRAPAGVVVKLDRDGRHVSNIMPGGHAPSLERIALTERPKLNQSQKSCPK